MIILALIDGTPSPDRRTDGRRLCGTPKPRRYSLMVWEISEVMTTLFVLADRGQPSSTVLRRHRLQGIMGLALKGYPPPQRANSIREISGCASSRTPWWSAQEDCRSGPQPALRHDNHLIPNRGAKRSSPSQYHSGRRTSCESPDQVSRGLQSQEDAALT